MGRNDNIKLKPNNLIRVPTHFNNEFFTYWLRFLGPFHNLTDKELDVLSVLLWQRYELSKVVSSEELLNSLVLKEEVRKKIMEVCNMSTLHLSVTLGKLKKKNILTDKGINKKFIPNVKPDTDSFRLLIYFQEENA